MILGNLFDFFNYLIRALAQSTSVLKEIQQRIELCPSATSWSAVLPHRFGSGRNAIEKLNVSSAPQNQINDLLSFSHL